eukprot:Lankesteria_metandrocarpae@DN5078_c0_g1_i2.p2
MGDDAGWEQGLRDAGLLSSCFAVAIGSGECQLFAAIADKDFPDPWAALYADDYEVDVTQDDGTKKKLAINEWNTVSTAFEPGAAHALYLGGQKYQFCHRDEQDEVTVVLAKKIKGGAVIVKTSNDYYIMGLYNEEKEQVVGTAIDAIVAYGQYMAST